MVRTYPALGPAAVTGTTLHVQLVCGLLSMLCIIMRLRQY